MNRRCWFSLIALGAASVALGYKEVPPPEKVVLPRALSPAESLASIKVPADLELELVAAEPLVADPIDIAWDAAGRMWVVEMADYPNGIDGRGRPGGRIRILESTKRDGRYDKSTLFVDNLSYPTSLLPWRNGVLVTAIPSVLFLEDTDGDGRADKTTKLYSGLAEGNQQHLANGLQWDLDGWLQMANGDSGGKVASLKTKDVIELGRRDFRIQPDTGAIELLAGQSQYGRNRDDWGNWVWLQQFEPDLALRARGTLSAAQPAARRAQSGRADRPRAGPRADLSPERNAGPVQRSGSREPFYLGLRRHDLP
jgi:putative membrane-bound dehydrogenase-like protein